MDPMQLINTEFDLWSLDRLIRHQDGAEFSAVGQVRFSKITENHIAWQEKGILTSSTGYRTDFTRAYRIQREKDEWIVHFSNGDYFYSWDKLDPHQCRTDTYSVHNIFTTQDNWVQIWTVVGLGKNYQMRSELNRIGSNSV